MNILINPNESVKAGDLKIGDEVYTRHQDTFEWGTYKVTSAERYIQPTVKVVIDEFQVEVSASHKFLTKDLKFVSISDLLVGDLIETTKGVKPILSIEPTGTKEVVKLESDTFKVQVFIDPTDVAGTELYVTAFIVCVTNEPGIPEKDKPV